MIGFGCETWRNTPQDMERVGGRVSYTERKRQNERERDRRGKMDLESSAEKQAQSFLICPGQRLVRGKRKRNKVF